ncbi:unnamed protein product [Effrenium voratum]|nr:unnamed protein product [Effrenium voratum]CAJ1432935.1 unnamed protein product [Effrenium voratum]
MMVDQLGTNPVPIQLPIGKADSLRPPDSVEDNNDAIKRLEKQVLQLERLVEELLAQKTQGSEHSPQTQDPPTFADAIQKDPDTPKFGHATDEHGEDDGRVIFHSEELIVRKTFVEVDECPSVWQKWRELRRCQSEPTLFRQEDDDDEEEVMP